MSKAKKRQGHYCRICGQHKANEKFSGRGHAAHICKACAKRGNKPPEIEWEPPVFIDVEDTDTEFAIENDLDFYPFFSDDEPQEQSAKPKRKRKPNKAKLLRSTQKKIAKTFLMDILADGDVSKAVIEKQANSKKIPHEALRRAKSSLGIRAIVTTDGSV